MNEPKTQLQVIEDLQRAIARIYRHTCDLDIMRMCRDAILASETALGHQMRWPEPDDQNTQGG